MSSGIVRVAGQRLILAVDARGCPSLQSDVEVVGHLDSDITGFRFDRAGSSRVIRQENDEDGS
jgi:hypothetical protein